MFTANYCKIDINIGENVYKNVILKQNQFSTMQYTYV